MGRSAGALFLSDEEEGSFGVGGAAGVRDCMFVLDCAAGLEVTLNRRSNKATPWRVRRLSEEPGLRRDFIHRVWRAFVLYPDPPEKALVLCGDAKSQVQPLDRPQRSLPMNCGTPETRPHDYRRCSRPAG